MPKSTKNGEKSPKRLVLPKSGKKIAGVAAGMANFFEVDVTLIRVIWVLALIPGIFPGLIAYLLCWLIIPQEESGRAIVD